MQQPLAAREARRGPGPDCDKNISHAALREILQKADHKHLRDKKAMATLFKVCYGVASVQEHTV